MKIVYILEKIGVLFQTRKDINIVIFSEEVSAISPIQYKLILGHEAHNQFRGYKYDV